MEQSFNEADVMKSRAVEVTHHAPLTSSEIANFWRLYVSYSAVKCIVEHFLNNVSDQDTRSVAEEGLSILKTRLSGTKEFLTRDGQPIPWGFSGEDLDVKAPRLFTDEYYLYYARSISKADMLINSHGLSMAARTDVREFFTETLVSTIRFWNRTADILLAKGLFTRPPFITTAKQVDMVKRQSFLGGFLTEKRPLLASEVEQLFSGILFNYVGMATLTGFRQVTRSEQVRKYMDRGVEIAGKHAEIFNAVLTKEGMPSPVEWEDVVTDSTVQPFSDKLMMYQASTMNANGLISYALSLALSMRHDLNANYARLIGEVANFAEDGINIMIDNGWFEEPPRMVDRRELVNKLKH